MSTTAPELETGDAVDELALERLRDRLLAKLRIQREHAERFYAWYRCRQEPPDMPAAADYAPAFNRMRQQARGAWARLVIDAIAERLVVQGVRTTAGDAADERAWKLLQDNRIDADQRDVHTEALIAGVSYVSVAGTGDDVTITPETALEVTHLALPGDRRVVDAAIKLMPLGGGTWLAELYTANLTATWQASYRDERRSPLGDRARTPWVDLGIVDNALGAVGVVPFENRPTVALPGLSELDELIPIMQRIQELELAKLIGVYSVTFPQKWATGLKVERNPETGQPLKPFEAGPMRLWASTSEATKFGAFPAGDIGQYLQAISDEVGELAAISRVPSYYLVQSNLANPPSAESQTTSETGLVTKCLDRQRSYGESWEQVVRLAATAAGDAEVGADGELEAIWHSPERRNPAVTADAATKLQAIGVPTEELWSFVGYSPQAIARMRVQAGAQAIREAAFAELPAPAPTP
jgi:Phage portal protein, SPP1 Gp6-like